MTISTRSYLDLINECDSFPYDVPLEERSGFLSTLYKFFLPDDSRPHGYMLAKTVEIMPWTSAFEIDHETRRVQLCKSSDAIDVAASSNLALSNLINVAIEKDVFRVIDGRHSEPYSIIGSNFPVSIERFASTLFGIVTRGAHLTVYTRVNTGIKIWVPRRSSTSFTYPNCLDTTVAGGVAAGESPFECVVREANEEASLPEDLVRQQARASGMLSYIQLNDRRGGGEIGLICPDTVYVYDLEVDDHVICRPQDGEVKEFYLMTVEEVQTSLSRAEFKANSALVMIDFFIRHGIITNENEKDYAQIATRLHRRLPFPTGPG